jgi:hypothetical protein
MPSSRYARLNPFGISQQTASPVAEEPLQFSNVIPDPSYNALPTSHVSDETLNSASKKNRFRVKHRAVLGTTDGLPYTGFDPNINPQPPSESGKVESHLLELISFRTTKNKQLIVQSRLIISRLRHLPLQRTIGSRAVGA